MAATAMAPMAARSAAAAQSEEWSEQNLQPRGMFIGTPEIYFAKRIDNSRVVKVSDPKRRRELFSFGFALSVLFLFTMVYLWQHFSAIEYGYRIEQARSQRDVIAESNRALRLEEASLKDPERIDTIAREQLGMQAPVAGQVQTIDSSDEAGIPVMARANGISVISMGQ